MRKEDVLEVLAGHERELRDLGVGSLYLFGSIVQGEVEPDCVIDILVELARPMGFFGFLEIEERIGEWLQQPVHLITPDVLKSPERERILGEAIRAA